MPAPKCVDCGTTTDVTKVRRATNGDVVAVRTCPGCATPSDLPEDVYQAALAALPDGYGSDLP